MSNEETVSVLISEGANQTVAFPLCAPTNQAFFCSLPHFGVAATVAGLLWGFIGGKNAPPMNNQVDDSTIWRSKVYCGIDGSLINKRRCERGESRSFTGQSGVEMLSSGSRGDRGPLAFGVWDEKVLGPTRRGSRMLARDPSDDTGPVS